MSRPLAFFLSWTTYGTRLHGDSRGSVDAEHNGYGRPLVPTNAARARFEFALLKGGPVRLSDPMRRVVRDTIIDDCRCRRSSLAALNVRTTHVHVVVASAIDPAKLAGRLKAWCTRRLRAAALAGDDPVWTQYSSTRWLWNDGSLARAIQYTLEEQGPVDEFAVRGAR